MGDRIWNRASLPSWIFALHITSPLLSLRVLFKCGEVFTSQMRVCTVRTGAKHLAQCPSHGRESVNVALPSSPPVEQQLYEVWGTKRAASFA